MFFVKERKVIFMTVSEKKFLMTELSKLTPNPEEKAKAILEIFEQLYEEVKFLRGMLTLSTVQYDLPDEVWKDIKGYEGFYQVSTKGRIKSFQLDKVRIMKLCFDRGGYVHIVLSKNGKRKTHRIHILVAKAFIPNPLNLPEVNHKNGNKWDCSVENLEWSTRKQNQEHAVRLGLQKSGADSHRAKLTEEQVRDIRENCIPSDKVKGLHSFARKYDVRLSVIQNVYHYRTYKNIK